MHRSFGIEATPNSMRWNDLMRGPSLAEVGAHLHKIIHYRALATVEAEESASVVHLPRPVAGEPAREADRTAHLAKRAA